MPERRSLSIPQTFLLYIVVFFALSAIVTSSLFLYFEYKTFEKQSKESKQAHIEAQNQLIKHEVNQVIEHINISRDIRINKINEYLTYRVDQAYVLAENIYTKHKNNYSKLAITQIIKEALRPLRSEEIRGDYFILKTDGEEILYPAHPEFEGTNFLKLKDSPEKLIVQEEVNIALKYGKGFIREKSTSLTTDKSFTSPSVIYVRLFKPLNIIIGTGEYIPDIEGDIKKEAIQYIKNIKYGVNQQIFINDTDGNVVLSNTKHYSNGDNILKLKDAKGFEIIKAEIEASKMPEGGFINFDWLNEDNNQIDKNISYVKAYPEWNWVIGAWFDLSLIETDINRSIQHMQNAQIKKATNILILIILIHLILLLIFRYVTHKTKKNTATFIGLLKKAIQSNSNIDKTKLNYSEFQIIADATNKIIENKLIADEELKKSELQFKSLFEIAPIMIFGLGKEGEIALWNKECERATGYSLDEVKTMDNPFKKLIQNKEEYNYVKGHLSKPSGQFNEFTITNKNQEERNQFWAGFTTPSNLTIGVGYDTTELKKTLTELNITADKLQEANLTKDKFLSIIAHDLKNPFNAIIGFSNILCTSYNEFDDATKLELIKDIQHSARLNFNLLEKMLEWAMSQSDQIPYHPEQLNLQDIIQDSISFASYQASQKKIELQSPDCSNMKIFADDNMLTSLLRNLISNAIKFTPENGTISIHAEDRPTDIKLSIKDTGVGMSADNIAKLFRIDTKVQTVGTKDEKGTGLGLLICKEFVDKHQGEIWVESELEQGCEFIITFPKQNLN
ncbi:PAS domain S-box protein [Ancylomarina euxinus]|uniref:histidine kinase n=1 Tax=Ancylomarina euxinus TaxID=2283627 RepID=A0A425Y5K3_9BACT|nr:cache domain-containing protein [Ancylomarina euxinus]MCZ4694172.1 cache domain-containing protein [Ancylomarina euxinus]MUP14497.1 PAS domain S-box protein [Ancylomarina euxinus]RRG23798.1 PAS domain S-box protein [Ancylomarina euxinus]